MSIIFGTMTEQNERNVATKKKKKKKSVDLAPSCDIVTGMCRRNDR